MINAHQFRELRENIGVDALDDRCGRAQEVQEGVEATIQRRSSKNEWRGIAPAARDPTCGRSWPEQTLSGRRSHREPTVPAVRTAPSHFHLGGCGAATGQLSHQCHHFPDTLGRSGLKRFFHINIYYYFTLTLI